MKKLVSLLLVASIVILVSCAGGGTGYKVKPDQGVVAPVVSFGEPTTSVHVSAEYKFGAPKPIAVNSKGQIICGGKDFGLSMYEADGKFIRDIGKKGNAKGEWQYTKGISIDKSDNIIVTDSIIKKIMIFDATGNFVREFTSDKLVDCGPNAIDAKGNIYVADEENGLVMFDNAGNFIKSLVPKSDTGKTTEFGYFAVNDAINRLYIGDDGMGEVDVYDLEGNYIMTFGGLGPEIYQLAEDIEGISIGPNNLVFVNDEAATERGAVKIYTADGKFVTAFGKGGIYEGEFASHEGNAYDPVNKRIVVADEKNNRIQSFSLESLGITVTP